MIGRMTTKNDPDLRPLDHNEISRKLSKLSDWKFDHNKITKTFEFSSFLNGIEFLNELAPFCDEIDHHPDIHIYYKKITFDLSRFSVGSKVTDRDFAVADKIEEIFRKSVQ